MTDQTKHTEKKNESSPAVRQATVFFTLIALVLLGYQLGTNREALKTALQNPFAAFPSRADSVSVKELATLLKNKTFTFVNVHTPYEGEIAQTDSFIPYDIPLFLRFATDLS